MVSRRAFLGGSAVLGGALFFPEALTSRRSAAGAALDREVGVNALGIDAAAGEGEDLVALVNTISGFVLVDLVRTSDDNVTLGRTRPIAFPSRFVAAALDYGPTGLLIGGFEEYDSGTVEIDNRQDHIPDEMRKYLPDDGRPNGIYQETVTRIRPALYVVSGDRMKPIPLPELPDWSFGSVSTVASRSDGSLALAIDHAEDDEARYASAADLLERTSSGSWSRQAITTGLGEGGLTLLAEHRNGLVAIVHRQGNQVEVLDRGPEGFAPSTTHEPVRGRVLAASSGPSGALLIRATPEGEIKQRELNRPSGRWRDVSSGGTGSTGIDVVPLNGFAREFLVIAGSTARITPAEEI